MYMCVSPLDIIKPSNSFINPFFAQSSTDGITFANLEAALQALTLSNERHYAASEQYIEACARFKESTIRHQESLLNLSVATNNALTMLRGKNC